MKSELEKWLEIQVAQEAGDKEKRNGILSYSEKMLDHLTYGCDGDTPDFDNELDDYENKHGE